MQHMIDYKKINKEISQHKRDRVHNNYVDESEDIVDYIALNDVIIDEDCSILNQSDDVLKPFWLDYDKE